MYSTEQYEALDCFERLLTGIINEQGITLSYRDKDFMHDEDGLYDSATKDVYILESYNVPDFDIRRNRLFIIAHEIGHHFCGPSDDRANSYVRVICNQLPATAQRVLARDIEYYSTP